MPAKKTKTTQRQKGQKFTKKLILGITAVILTLGIAFGVYVGLTGYCDTSYETFDDETGECYYECETEEECKEIEAKIEAELDGYFSEARPRLNTASKPVAQGVDRTGDEDHVFTHEETGSDTDGIIYTVRSDKSFVPKPSDDDLYILKLVQHVIPNKDYLKYLETIEVYDDNENDFAAMVWQSNSPGKWHMSINRAYSEDQNELVLTILHEYAHIISLQESQIDYEYVEGACPWFEIDEGCVKDGAYIKRFTELYWHKFGDDVPQEGAGDEEVGAFYARHAGDFITEYAATNVVEDFAETFASFVVSTKPKTSSPLYNEKIRYMYEQPDLAKLRKVLRTNISDLIK